MTLPATSRRGATQRSLFLRMLERPQQVGLRRAIFQVHLWAGILLGLYVIVIGVSGSILVFKEELLPRPRVSLPHQDLRRCTADQLARAITLANRSVRGHAAYLALCPDEADPMFAVSMRKRILAVKRTNGIDPTSITVYIDPLKGRLVGLADTEHSWIQWVDDLHVYLLAGRTGEQWNGAGAAVLLLLVLTGTVLWWPGLQRWTRALVPDFRRGWRRLNWDLHNVIGLWTLLFTLIWATTGIYFAWPTTFTSAINRLSPVTTAQYPAAELTAAAAAAEQGSTHFDLLSVLRETQQMSPNAALEGCFYGFGPHAVFTVYMARGRIGDYANTDFVYFDQASGRHIYTWHRGENATLGDWLLWLTTPLHFGTSWGLPVKVLWACLGMALPVLAITGFLMYWNRYLRTKFRQLGSSSSSRSSSI